MNYTREEALDFLNKHVKSLSLTGHCMAVEASMRGYAKHFSEDVERWGMCGLLHDIDFELYPEDHPIPGLDILRKEGFDEEFIRAVQGHASENKELRDTNMAKTLYAVDELSSFVIACVLVRPNKFDGLKLKSVKKKLKDKAFAKAVNRENIKDSADELGVDLSEHIQIVIDSLVDREKELNAQNMSLIG